MLTYLSLCSGIEAASVAWQPLGWQPVAFAEIEPFPCAVLAHHYPHVPNLGDMTTIDGSKYRGTVDLIVGGTPCQSFSVAGKRGGISDPRGALALAFVELVRDVSPRWIVWENVPGVFSSGGGADFKAFANALVDIGYPVAWRVLDAQYFGVPQRRRRVYIVGYLGDWRPAAAVLFEPHSLRGNHSPRRKKAKDIAGAFTSCAYSGGLGCRPEGAANGHFVPQYEKVARTLTNRHDGSPCYDRGPNIVATPINTQVELRHKALGERTGLGIGKEGDPAFTLQGSHSHAVHNHKQGVRRLTPLECERLQGFPDHYTDVPHKGKIAAGAPRYRAIGNSMAVPVMRWIEERIGAVSGGIAG